MIATKVARLNPNVPSEDVLARVRSDLDRLVSPIPVTGCWMWMGSLSTKYGTYYRLGRNYAAHRLVFLALGGAIPDGLVLHHKCRNCWCVNPDHLEPLSNKANVLAGTSPTAANGRKTHCYRGHPLSGDNLLRKNRSLRECRTCYRIWRILLKMFRRNRQTLRRIRGQTVIACGADGRFIRKGA